MKNRLRVYPNRLSNRSENLSTKPMPHLVRRFLQTPWPDGRDGKVMNRSFNSELVMGEQGGWRLGTQDGDDGTAG
jgi:hypothetical protein